MIHGLLWLPLLLVFFALAGLGWYEWQKLQAYERWAVDFTQAKYDIRAVLGYGQQQLTWGTPTRTTPKNLQTLALKTITDQQVWVDQQPIEVAHPPARGTVVELVLWTTTQGEPVKIPFTDPELASHWAEFLRRQRQDLILPGLGTPPTPSAS